MSAPAADVDSHNAVDAQGQAQVLSPETSPDAAAGGIQPDGEAAADLKITIKEAADLVRAQTPAALLTLLKKPEFSEAVGRVFAGYRVSIDNLKTPLTRGRLTSELVTNTKLLDALLALPHPSPPPATPPLAAKPSAPKGAAPVVKASTPMDDSSDRVAQLASERDALRLELREMHAALQRQQEGDEKTHRMLRAMEVGLAESRAKLTAEQASAAWRERRLRRLERELAETRQHAASLEKRPPENRIARIERSAATSPPLKLSDTAASSDARLSDTLFDALDRLLSRGKIEPARLLADEMLHGDSGNVDALRIRALARLAQGDRPAALLDLRSIFDGFIVRHESLQAARAMLRWMAISGTPDAKMAQSLYASVSRESIAMIAEVRETLLGLRESEPEQYATLRSWCQTALAGTLFAGGDEQGVAVLLPTQLVQFMAQSGVIVSPKALVAALNQADEPVVYAARAALAKIDKRSQEQALIVIAEAADGDESYGRLLIRRALAGGAVVDASNVANYERELIASARPLLSNIAAVRRALRERGYFPVHIIADANLPHVIDSPDQLWGLVQRGEVELVKGGTVADEVIVREARRLGATIISNDYMMDWDPAGETAKMQYSVSLTDGRATLYE